MILLIYGEDTVNAGRKLLSIKNKYKNSFSGINLIELNGELFDLSSFLSAVGSPPLFESKKLVIIKNFFHHNGGSELEKKLIDHIDKIGEEIVLVFFEEGEIKSTDLFKKINKPKLSEKFPKPSQNSLPAWISNEVSVQGGEIDIQSAIYLIAKVGDDLTRLANEITKLIAYDPKISRENIDLLVKEHHIEEKIFALTDSIGVKDKKKALQTLNNLISKGEEPNALFSLLLKQFENLLVIKGFKQQISETEMSKKSGIHPYVIKKSNVALKRFGDAELKERYLTLANFEFSIRKGDIGVREALENFIFAL